MKWFENVVNVCMGIRPGEKVLLITDPSSSVAALIQSSRAPGIVSGHLGRELTMNYLPQEETVNVGDVVLTSGMGGDHPKGLVIGQVVEVHRRDIDPFQEALVRPAVNFDKLENVLVITSFEPVDVQGAIDQEPTPAYTLTPKSTVEPQIQGTPTP